MSASLLVVIDGATGLSGNRMDRWPSDAQWFAHSLAALLAEYLDDGLPLASIVKDCLEELGAEYDENEDGLGPSASLLIARILGQDVEVYSLGDCLTLVGIHDGTVEAIRDTSVAHFDAAVIARLQDLRGDLSLEEAKPIVQDLLVANRNLRNTSHGYWIADLSGDGVTHALTRTFPAAEIRDIALMTDGFAAVMDTVRLADTPAKFLEELRKTGPEPVLDALMGRLTDDPDCTRFPRLKPVDDSSIIIAAVLSGPAI